MEEQKYKFVGSKEECLDHQATISAIQRTDGYVTLADIKALFNVPINSPADYTTAWKSMNGIEVKPDQENIFYILSLPEPTFLFTPISVEQEEDLIHHPSHYMSKTGLEVLDVIKAFTDDIKPYYEGNILKYICRWKKKNGLQDLQKAREYLDLLIEEVENEKEDK